MNNNDDQSSFRETILLTAVMGDHTADTVCGNSTAPSTAQGDSCQAIAIQPAAPRAAGPEHANNPPPPASTTSAPVPAPAAPPAPERGADSLGQPPPRRAPPPPSSAREPPSPPRRPPDPRVPPEPGDALGQGFRNWPYTEGDRR